ncbi:Iron-sulfur clusters incorporation protein [Blomia tropicalis]|nr:Iron-sulfur clusters incorporation protein [Blomia tropicalis]
MFRQSLYQIFNKSNHCSLFNKESYIQKIFQKRRYYNKSNQTNHQNGSATLVAIRLSNRRFLRVCGEDSFIYLQSLLTNDMRMLLSLERLEKERNSSPGLEKLIESNALNQPVIYTYLLSAVGRVLADMFVYRGRYRTSDGEYIIEIDSKLANAMKRLFLGYNLSRNIRVEFANDIQAWVIIPINKFTDNNNASNDSNIQIEEIDSDDIKLVADPRVGSSHIGYRLLTRLGATQIEDIGQYIQLQNYSKKVRIHEGTIGDYVQLRYRLGIPEGYKDILSGHYYPFELNGDILNAISLNKGLYTSEEKIIKIYSREPIQRRLFPVQFHGSISKIRQLHPAPRTLIDLNSQKFGELFQRYGRNGIASLWVPLKNNYFTKFNQDNGSFPLLTHKDTGLKMSVSIPNWWPTQVDQLQLPVPDYPKCLFNLKDEELESKDFDMQIKDCFPEDIFRISSHY